MHLVILKLLGVLILTLFSCVIVRLHDGERRSDDTQKKPNIIFILADDLGWNDIGFHNPFIKTPHIDWLARNGIELTSHYTQQACTPSRSALMTGRYPSNTGLHQSVILHNCKSCLPLEFKILPQYLKEEGYITKYIGKWHLGACSRDCLATARGFDEYRGILTGEVDDYYTWEREDTYFRLVNETTSFENLGTHITLVDKMDTRDVITKHTINHADQPLFLVLSPTAPHSPLQVTEEMFDVHDSLTKPEQIERRKFLGLVSALDDLVGETIQTLRDTDMYENTVIVFTSDNGGATVQIDPLMEAHGNNYPLRGQKFDAYEGGILTPTIYYNPRLPKSTRGTKRDFLMHITDWLPTLLQLANPLRTTVMSNLDGVSQISNLMKDYSAADRYSVREQILLQITDSSSVRYPGKCSNTNTAYRLGDWKLIYGEDYIPADGSYIVPAESPSLPEVKGDSCLTTENGRIVIRCLFNIRDDPFEQKNLYRDKPWIVRRLLNRINFYKSIRVERILSLPLGVTNETTYTTNNLNVAKLGFCEPSVDFPLQSIQDPLCIDVF